MLTPGGCENMSSCCKTVHICSPENIQDRSLYFTCVKRHQPNTSSRRIHYFIALKKWRHAGNTFPLSISFVPFAFKLHHKLCATLRSFCHWPLLMCKFTSLPDCDFVHALTVYINKLRRNGCTSLHSFTCADNNWMTNTAKSKHWQECDGKQSVREINH